MWTTICEYVNRMITYFSLLFGCFKTKTNSDNSDNIIRNEFDEFCSDAIDDAIEDNNQEENLDEKEIDNDTQYIEENIDDTNDITSNIINQDHNQNYNYANVPKHKKRKRRHPKNIIPEKIMMSNIDIIWGIQPYIKLIVNNNLLQYDQDMKIIQCVKRWKNGQSRDKTIEVIKYTIKSAIYYIKSNHYIYSENECVGLENNSIIDKIKSTVNGLNNLIITYPNKIKEINAIIGYINNFVSTNN